MSKLDIVHLVPVPSPNGTNHGRNYFRVNEGWSQEDLLALDAAPTPQPYLSKLTAESGRKKQDFAPGGLRDEYAPDDEDVAEDDEGEGDDDLFGKLRALGVTNTTLAALRTEMNGRGKQAEPQFGSVAEDDDQPPNAASGGTPQRGGTMSALKQAQDTVLRQGNPAMAYDEGQARARYKRLVKRHPKAAKKFFEQQAKSAKSFAERHPNVARIGQV